MLMIHCKGTNRQHRIRYLARAVEFVLDWQEVGRLAKEGTEDFLGLKKISLERTWEMKKMPGSVNFSPGTMSTRLFALECNRC